MEEVRALEPGLTWGKVLVSECAGMRECREGLAPEAAKWLGKYQAQHAAGGTSPAAAKIKRLASGPAGFLGGAAVIVALVAFLTRRTRKGPVVPRRRG